MMAPFIAAPLTAAPVVSVLMAAYNGAALIRDTLASLSRQTMPDWEAIVVDDCSTDETRAIVAAWPDARVRLVTQEVNGGPVCARNRALAEARGRFVAGLDHDDLCAPDRFARQLAYLDRHPCVALLGTQADLLRDGVVVASGYPAHTTPALIHWLSWIENPLVWSSVMMRGEAARALDPFTRPDMTYAEDFDLYHRVRPGGLARLDDVLVTYRVHPGGASQRHLAAMRRNAARVLADVHAGRLGEEAEPVARLLAHHVMGGEPVPDRATLIRLGAALTALQQCFFDELAPAADDRKLIRWETAHRWGRIGRAALRTGTLTLAEVATVRPDHLGLGYAGPGSLLASGARGAARRLAGERRAR